MDVSNHHLTAGRDEGAVMTCSMPGPKPVPAPAQP